MGKKNKKLKRKKGSPQLATVAASNTADIGPGAESAGATEPEVPASAIKEAEEVAEEFKYVKKDVRKILLLMLGIVILLLGFYFLDQYTHYLNTLGGWFYKIFNIQTQ